jgi:hypothetical protein
MSKKGWRNEKERHKLSRLGIKSKLGKYNPNVDEYDGAIVDAELDREEKRMHCDQCNACMINGIFCHETGCPNSKKKWEDGEWVRYHDCFECGYPVKEGEICGCNADDRLG